MVNWKKTGKKVKVLMNENGYTVKIFAATLCVSESTIKNYLYSGNQIPVERLFQMARLFQLDRIEDILVFENVIA